MKVTPEQLLWPVKAQAVVESVLDFITDDPLRSRQPIMSHGFSVGGYLYGETLVKILDRPDKYGSVAERLRGQVYDSPVDVHGIPKGVSQVSIYTVRFWSVK